MSQQTPVQGTTRYEAVIGLEVHVELSTHSKMFCGCRNVFGAEPNTLVCPICLGMPGTLPVINRRAVEFLCKTGLALGCTIASHSKFDRKNYFYPDMPKNYQISQYDMPLTTGGSVELPSGKVVRLNRIHLEEDTGKNIHAGGHMAASDYTLIDYNRAGVPLMEVVTEPDIASPEEAEEYLLQLKTVLLYLGVSDVKMHEGSLRCDANVSVRPAGSTTLGTKAEVKNMNSFRSVVRALQYEITRQEEAVRKGERIVQETRNWDETRGVTYSTRSKEQAHDYRYFPDPDLVPLTIEQKTVEQWRSEMPELPLAKRKRFVAAYELADHEAGLLTEDRVTPDFYEAAVAASKEPKLVANWMLGDVRKFLEKHGLTLATSLLRPQQLAALIKSVTSGKISGKAAKEVCDILVAEGGDPQQIIEKRGLAQVSDESAIKQIVDDVLAQNADSVAAYKGGKVKVLEFLVGQVMKASRGKANIEIVRAMLVERLG
jgi:aspartyl-tRNA(Asn)/glutamyl-tRNA(Gln) amidotransferase subunit B